MFVSRVALENFRNLEALDLSFSRGFVVLHGPNGVGKTNFLEALYFNLTLNRFQESKLGQLFREDKDFFRVTMEADKENERETFVQKTEKSYQYQFKQNGKKATRGEFSKEAAAVSFLPQDLNLLTRSPGGRRRYLDETLSAASAEYNRHASQYNKTLRQRNELLTRIAEGETDPNELAVWSEKLAEHGSFLTKQRQRFLGFVKENSTRITQEISPELMDIEFIYVPSGSEDKQSFLKILEDKKQTELRTTATAAGPHRDDFRVLIGAPAGGGIKKDAVGYLSRGQMRATTLILKILETNYIEKQKKFSPILLLDDVFSEFDHAHQQKLIEFLKGLKQVFLTTAHLEEIERQLPEDAQVFRIERGRVKNV